MSHPRIYFTAVLALGIAAALLVGWPRIETTSQKNAQHTNDLDQQPGATSVSVTQATPQATNREEKVIIPPYFSGFLDWPEQRQHETLSALERNPHVSADVIVYLRLALRDQQLNATSRNYIVNVMMAQDVIDQDLWRQLLKMSSDPTETYQWRDYAVQHLGVIYPLSGKPYAVLARLLALAKDGERAIPGTAMLHLHHLEQQGAVDLGEDFDRLLQAAACDPKRDTHVRITALGLIGERHIAEALPKVRELISSREVALRRVAIATIGFIGNNEDRAAIEQFTRDSDESVKGAARGALARLDKRTADQSADGTTSTNPASSF
jgi:HEAT repeats